MKCLTRNPIFFFVHITYTRNQQKNNGCKERLISLFFFFNFFAKICWFFKSAESRGALLIPWQKFGKKEENSLFNLPQKSGYRVPVLPLLRTCICAFFTLFFNNLFWLKTYCVSSVHYYLTCCTINYFLPWLALLFLEPGGHRPHSTMFEISEKSAM